jgi:tyrosine-specific transport protein
MTKTGSLLGGSLLVAGTTIGGGMLALPVLTSPGGFIPSLFIYVACWLFMTATGLLFLEISLQMEDNANLISMADKTLGLPGKIFAWILYLFLFYCLTVAYVVGCGDLITELAPNLLPRELGPLLFVLLFSPFIYAGARIVGKLNIFLMLGLGLLYCAFVGIGAKEVRTELLLHRNWSLSLLALPIAFTAFAYQGTVPTLVHYMGRDAAKIRKSIWIGTTCALVTYIIWQWLILGIIPYEGESGLKEALMQGQNAVYPLKNHLNTPEIYLIGRFFAFFALITSFFGVTLGLQDFLADGLNIQKTAKGKVLLLLLVFIPPLAISAYYPHLFLQALDYAGGYGVALLLGLLPVAMAWKMRKIHPETDRQLIGGNALLAVMALFVIFECIIEITT